ncbi:hypothetical protein Q0M94_11995 [Deinococcus radiomollis]|uniref:hypothetical protein n=1 Tax=Deinococcus radiomollis TaxID=468916 RepID=UPI003892981F
MNKQDLNKQMKTLNAEKRKIQARLEAIETERQAALEQAVLDIYGISCRTVMHLTPPPDLAAQKKGRHRADTILGCFNVYSTYTYSDAGSFSVRFCSVGPAEEGYPYLVNDTGFNVPDSALLHLKNHPELMVPVP